MFTRKWVSLCSMLGVPLFDVEHRGQLGDARLYPAAAVVEVLAAVPVSAAQKGAAHAAGDDVVPGRVGERNKGGARAGHGAKDNGSVVGGQEISGCPLFERSR